MAKFALVLLSIGAAVLVFDGVEGRNRAATLPAEIDSGKTLSEDQNDKMIELNKEQAQTFDLPRDRPETKEVKERKHWGRRHRFGKGHRNKSKKDQENQDEE